MRGHERGTRLFNPRGEKIVGVNHARKRIPSRHPRHRSHSRLPRPVMQDRPGGGSVVHAVHEAPDTCNQVHVPLFGRRDGWGETREWRRDMLRTPRKRDVRVVRPAKGHRAHPQPGKVHRGEEADFRRQEIHGARDNDGRALEANAHVIAPESVPGFVYMYPFNAPRTLYRLTRHAGSIEKVRVFLPPPYVNRFPDRSPELRAETLLPPIATFLDEAPLATLLLPHDARVVLHMAEVALVRIDARAALAYLDAGSVQPSVDWLFAAGIHGRAICGEELVARAIAVARGEHDSAHLRAFGATLTARMPVLAVEAYLADDDRTDALGVIASAMIPSIDRRNLLPHVQLEASPDLLARITDVIHDARARLQHILSEQPVLPPARVRPGIDSERSAADTHQRHIASLAPDLHDIAGDDLVARLLEDAPRLPPAEEDRAAHARASEHLRGGRYEESLSTLVPAGLIDVLVETASFIFGSERLWARRFFAAAEGLRDLWATRGEIASYNAADQPPSC